jgi:hypothetical protein
VPRKRDSVALAEELFCAVVSEGKHPWYTPLDDTDRWYPQWDAIIDATESGTSWSAFADALGKWRENHPDSPVTDDAFQRTWSEASSESRARWITGYIYNDTTPLPVSVAERLQLPDGISYASAVRRLRRVLGDRVPGVVSKYGRQLSRIHVSLPDETIEVLQAEAAREGISISAIFRRAIDYAMAHPEEFEAHLKNIGADDSSTLS